MKFLETKIQGVYVIELKREEDERGFFARSFCQREFEERSIPMRAAQCNVSGNKFKGTLRGMHYQEAPFEEEKIVSCVKGRIYDVTVDLRKDSPMNLQWFGIELSADNHTALYIPKGCAHGFQTLENDSIVLYVMSEYYSSKHSQGVRWNDPVLNISWPLFNPILSDKDSHWPLLPRQ
ncbi:MAG: dTDP-4-dehydrorhamnose 3,5-epimerase [Candidatus Wildermuthbacteria bacterium]|nr:dTDP-4-dehydrorhamnose 3,5-epimerase [Candidatus Wildermuthbacteria bacterium]